MTLADLSDTVLDTAFAASFDSGDHAAAQYYGDEIRTRLISATAFLSGVFGHSSFPLYEARLKFSQSDAARTSLAKSASNVGQGIATSLKAAVGGAVVFALVAVGVYAFFSSKK